MRTDSNGATETFGRSLVAALAEIEGATKDRVNPAFKSKYADLAAVIDTIRPVLAMHGLAFTQHTEPSEEGVIVETFVRHESGEKESLGKLFVPANKRDAQGFGSALTYARRYSLMTAFGVPTEDDDGNAAVQRNGNGAAKSGAPKMIADDQRDLIQTLAPGAGKTLQDICKAYRVDSLKELTEAQATKLIDRLSADAKEKVDA